MNSLLFLLINYSRKEYSIQDVWYGLKCPVNSKQLLL